MVADLSRQRPEAKFGAGRDLLITDRVVCIRVTCCSSRRTPRTFVDMTDPMATMEMATTASAIKTSMIVKPAS